MINKNHFLKDDTHQIEYLNRLKEERQELGIQLTKSNSEESVKFLRNKKEQKERAKDILGIVGYAAYQNYDQLNFSFEYPKNWIINDTSFTIVSRHANHLGNEIAADFIKYKLESLMNRKPATEIEVIDADVYVPQHRERIFIAGFNKEYFNASLSFNFPEPPQDEQKIRTILEKIVDEKYTLTDNLWQYLQNYAKKHRELGNGFGFGLVDKNRVSRTLSARYYKDGSEILIPQGIKENPRRLTPEECKRLMGYPKQYKIKNIGVSDTQLYKQFGNSVAVPVVRAVAESIMQAMISFDKDIFKILELKEDLK